MVFSYSVLYYIVGCLCVTSKVSADCSYVDGNYYCSQAEAIDYEGIGFSGSYSDVTNMDETSCECSQSSVSFSGTMSPLDEELSVHFRGPLKLAQFGVYYPASSTSAKVKRDAEGCASYEHVHHKHKRAAAVQIVEETTTVYADASGNIINPSTSAVAVASGVAAVASAVVSAAASSAASSVASSAASSSSSSSSAVAGDWVRSSYYTPGTGDNVTFLNHQGGVTDSGTWSTCFGNSLSYCASDGVSGSSSSEVLSDVTIKSDVEYLIMSGSECGDSSASGDCGYYRTDTPAYHGFSGADKIFVFEFEMPSDTGSGDEQDMPAIWLLNAKIPRTLQYGEATCSCWTTGCGELDLFEILSAGSDKLISHLHDAQGSTDGTVYGGSGSQDYFARPTDSTMKAAAVFTDGNVYIVELDDSTDFSSTLTSDTVSSWTSTDATVVQIS
ncbi:hypothetical protein FOA43_002954 [Brettanomyces nanus]|uniref:glucan endo-1,3-beta-D-glucosidase n=1 Tax=Eeniella nana TaxID=13502 RepID=A0A875RVJ6_EENNA|nr:uncharacterized protein FOA43_002954 [Brettanomyces nanus]QPG75597.1 hypothetical protein FOA43_002954 [Brettanomyces nanus]